MLETLLQIEKLSDVGAVLTCASDFASKLGVVRQSYHFSPVFDSANSSRTAIVATGFSDAWLELYHRRDFRARDPIPARTMHYGTRITWQDAIALEENTPEHQEYFASMRDHGLIHGFGLPLFGPGGREAYVGLDYGRPIDEVDPEHLIMLGVVAQAAQIRVSRLLTEARAPPTLSEREAEVLRWLAMGKSVAEIATILSLSPETVRTYAKRLSEKLGTHNRVGTIIRALKLNLLRL